MANEKTYKVKFAIENKYVAEDVTKCKLVKVIAAKGDNFEPTIVSDLPATGDSSKLYLTPKAHTTSTATGNPITATVAEEAGKLESFQLDGDTFQQATPSPSPENPQPIQTVTGEQTVSVIGKNLFNKNAVTNGGYIDTNGEVVAWETFGYSEYIRVIGGQTYSYSGTANNTGYSAKAAWYDSNKNFISYFSFGTSGQVTAPATAKFLRTSVRIASPSGLDTYQLELGSTITTYEAYRATNYPLDLGSIELCKLGDYQDYIYKDGDNWKVHKWIGKYTYDGTESNWAYSTNVGEGANVNGVFYRVKPTGADGTNYPNPSVSISDRFISGVRTPTNAGTFIIGTNITFASPSATIDNVTEWTQWLASNNTTVYYKYSAGSVTDTVITDTDLIAQLEAIRTASLATGTSTITNNATTPNLAGDMEIGYYGYNPTNRYDKWIWLSFDNSYEQLNNPEPIATLSTRSLSTTTEQTTPTRSVETVTLKKGASDTVSEKTELDPVEKQEEIEEKAGVPVERDIEETRLTEADEKAAN